MAMLTWDFVQGIFKVAGGLGLFLYGMLIMSDGLENMAGDRLRVILERATANRFIGIAIGAVVTCVIQSSSATTVMVVSFVNANLLTLTQAIGVIMGANIGTTITAQIIAFKIDPIAPLLIFVGLIMYFAFNKRNVKNLGYIILGFGILFFGISTMGAPLKEFSQLPGFQSILLTFQNPFLAFLSGVLFTAIVQSSSVTTGIVVAMYLSGVDLSFNTAVFIVLGSNVGTCTTAILASLTASRESKRAALAHTLFNVIGCCIFGTLILLFPEILTWIQHTWKEGARQVAMFHTLFNVSTTIMLMAFIKQLAALVHKIIPEIPDEEENAKKLVYLDPSVLQVPTIAITQARRELSRMGNMAKGSLELSLDAFYTSDAKKAAQVKEIEQTINYLNHQITTYLVRIRGLNLSEKDIQELGSMMHTVSDIERIGDHAENIADYAMVKDKFSTCFSWEATKELHILSQATIASITCALHIFDSRDTTKLPLVDELEDMVDRLSMECVENHIQRLQAEVCEPRSGVIFTDMVIDLERCADHANNIAYSIQDSRTWSIERPETVKQNP